MFLVSVEAEAKREWNEGVDWYEEQQEGVGLRFNTAVFAVLQTLTNEPERFRLVGRLTRKAKLIGWPYSVYFTVNHQAGEVVVVAIWHGRRNPAILRRRLQ